MSAKLIEKSKTVSWSPPNIHQVEQKDVDKYLDIDIAGIKNPADFFITTPESAPPSMPTRSYGPYHLIHKSDSKAESSSVVVKNQGVSDFSHYPNNLGLPTELEIGLLLEHAKFLSADDVVKFLSRDIIKPGLPKHIKNMIRRKTIQEAYGLKWHSASKL